MKSRSVEVETFLLTTVDSEVGRALRVSKASWWWEQALWSFCRGGKKIGLVCQDSMNSSGCYFVHAVSGIYSQYLLFFVTLTELQVGCIIIRFIPHSHIRAMHPYDACYLHASCTACPLVRMMMYYQYPHATACSPRIRMMLVPLIPAFFEEIHSPYNMNECF